jgi:ornithine cyclodeaminase
LRPDEILIVDRDTVGHCLAKQDPVALVEEMLHHHAAGATVLPAEGYLAWRNGSGAYTRAIAMLGGTDTASGRTYGMKLINASVSNPGLGIERAGGFTVLFDPETARPTALVEAGHISAERTAAYTISTLRTLGPAGFDEVSLVGCGTLARAHVRLLRRDFPEVRRLHVYDLDPDRARQFEADVTERFPTCSVRTHPDAASCVSASRVLVTLTVSDTPYITAGSVRPGTFVAHVSLDDLLPEVFQQAQAVYVDDLELVRDNPRRILGALIRDGGVVVPGTVGAPASGPGRAITGAYGDVLRGASPAIRPDRGFVVSNPFGMAIADVVMCRAVVDLARAEGLGTTVDLLGAATRAGGTTG